MSPNAAAITMTERDGDIDLAALNRYRLERLQAELRAADCGAAFLYDPVNVRYATGVRNMQQWSMHALSRSAFVPAEGKVVLFEYAGSEHLADGVENVGEVRVALARHYPPCGNIARFESRTLQWAAEIEALMSAFCGRNRRLAIDHHVDFFGGQALRERGLELFNAQEQLARAQVIKSPEEIRCVRHAVAACELAIARMGEALVPGVTEDALWAVLQGANIELGGESTETRLLSSGARTNPWYQEAGRKRVGAGELVSFDTDMIGLFGYQADVSRSFLCGGGRPTAEQRRLYRVAYDELHHNLALLKAGLSFDDFARRVYRRPDDVAARRVVPLVHGVGMYGLWPTVSLNPQGTGAIYDGLFEAGMTVCVESFVGATAGGEGVKLEQQVVITDGGYELLSLYPFDENLLGREF